MKRTPIFWRLFPVYFLTITIALLVMAWYSIRSVTDFYMEETFNKLRNRAALVRDVICDEKGFELKNIDDLVKRYGKKMGVRVTVILPSGEVIGDSESDPAKMENHSERPEVRVAFQGRESQARHFSHTLGKNMMYYGCPITNNGSVAAVLRMAIPLTTLDEKIYAEKRSITYTLLIMVLLTAVVVTVISRNISRPLEQMKEGTRKFAGGDLKYRMRVPDIEEMADLAESMNNMAAELQERINTVNVHRNEIEAILSSMVEGVVAIDVNEKVIHINRAAESFLWLESGHAIGKSLQEAIRNAQLQDVALRALKSDMPVEAEITAQSGDEKRYMQVNGTVLKDSEARRIGALIVLNDVTRLRKLEDIRKEFVANVSHELKTPITSIKGFVETLQYGSVTDPAEIKHFLGIIAKQSDRLNAIINDILSLSRVEYESEHYKLELVDVSAFAVIKDAIEVCEDRAKKKNVKLVIECDSKTKAMMNAPLMEQALVNLIDNAVKYSKEGDVVRIGSKLNNDGISIYVSDEGVGIEKSHLDRLFERFYRVDKGRSRQMGGTGLGLAIVKHIVLAHRGNVAVKSEPGKGSTFTINLQKA